MPRSQEPKSSVGMNSSLQQVHTERDLWLSALRSAVTRPPWKESDRYRNSLLRG
ncbi:hypothetical protein [Alicyclobacillus mengziensis]|uniref:Uncharacterized protein n=1 Tax=Alicyclobacillus mengziensis TaxID=2931921 RepID=A0A9X7VW24_9BACL|nr:hypothetical protein [Alicyclobacillus mengziensis]QSO45689.1 hypothetical protein JZ786_14130 [Alicyclobacillus mengziensis]